jgi:hypothetical protein
MPTRTVNCNIAGPYATVPLLFPAADGDTRGSSEMRLVRVRGAPFASGMA